MISEPTIDLISHELMPTCFSLASHCLHTKPLQPPPAPRPPMSFCGAAFHSFSPLISLTLSPDCPTDVSVWFLPPYLHLKFQPWLCPSFQSYKACLLWEASATRPSCLSPYYLCVGYFQLGPHLAVYYILLSGVFSAWLQFS